MVQSCQGEAMQGVSSSGAISLCSRRTSPLGWSPFPVTQDTLAPEKIGSFLSKGGRVALSGSSGTPKPHSLGLAKVRGKLGGLGVLLGYGNPNPDVELWCGPIGLWSSPRASGGTWAVSCEEGGETGRVEDTAVEA